MRRKAAKTLNLPGGLTEVATAYAEATGRSLSSLIEDLLREELKRSNALPYPTAEQVLEKLRERLAATEKRQKKRAAKIKDVPEL